MSGNDCNAGDWACCVQVLGNDSSCPEDATGAYICPTPACCVAARQADMVISLQSNCGPAPPAPATASWLPLVTLALVALAYFRARK